ncbi:MAG: glycosyltransferase [Desulfuromonadaceae bacterium]
MRMLIVVPRQNRATGNWVTGRRFQRGLERYGHQVRLCDTPLDAAVLQQQLAAFAPDLVLLLHAYRSGRPWLEARGQPAPPCLLLLTGTDINQGIHDALQSPVIEAVLANARAILLQNPRICADLRRDRPELGARLHYLPPGIELGEAPYDLRGEHGLSRDRLLFCCPASLRPVKGVLELLYRFDDLARRRHDFHLAFCGPPLDKAYAQQFLTALAERPWASYLGTIPVEAMPAALRQVDVVVNNSVCEGMPNILLEAVILGRPVLAHAIAGNAAIIEPGVNGLLYANDRDFLRFATLLVDDVELRQK